MVHDDGKPAHCLCQYRVSKMRHEVKLTEELIMWPEVRVWDWLRGCNTNSTFRPDAEQPFVALEYDSGEEGRRQVQKQCKTHRPSKKPTVWVLERDFEKRRQWIKEASNSLTYVKEAGSKHIEDMAGNSFHITDFVQATKRLAERRT